ncbi:MAG: VCBS repeat-containing protein [Polyangiaceae bacterium]
MASTRVVLSIGCVLLLPLSGCSCDAGVNPTGGGGSGATSAGGDGGAGATSFVGGGGSTGSFAQGGSVPVDVCKVNDSGSDNAVTPCVDVAPANSFSPAVQWTWTAPPPTQPDSSYVGSFSTPLVGNLTDDNADGAVDLCDVPDILITSIDSVVFSAAAPTASARLFMLRGTDGAEETVFSIPVDGLVYGALGDIDNDGVAEVLWADTAGHLTAFEADGSVKWTSPQIGNYKGSAGAGWCTTINIYDLDADGTPEILFGWEVYDNTGNYLFGTPTNGAEYDYQYWCVTPTAADLDGDGKLEVLFGNQTYHADGTPYWSIAGPPQHPHVANLDADPDPEVFLTSTNGLTVVEHDGTLKFGPVRPTDPNPAPNCWGKPAVIHDFNGDGKADIAASTCTDYTMYSVSDTGVTPVWTSNVSDFSGLATATGFDFLGDGVAEAIYADETQIYVFDGATGEQKLTSPRTSGTLIEYPVVADVDNDGSAEIVYVSNYLSGQPVGPTLTVLRDAEDRWIPARRIWNQYSYHVTNVREDGTIPQHMKKSWQLLNTFRTNSQISSEGDCDPVPQ